MHASPAPAPPPASAGLVVPPALGTRSAFVTIVLGWVLPGLGQIYVGRPLKGLVMLVTVGGLFLGGLALTGFTCVNPATYELEFVAHAFLGGPTAAAYWLTRDVVLAEPMPYFEVGRLYAAVAGLLNIVAICDALTDVLEKNRAAYDRALEREAFFEELAAAAEDARAAQETAALVAASRSMDEVAAPAAPPMPALEDAPPTPLRTSADEDPAPPPPHPAPDAAPTPSGPRGEDARADDEDAEALP